jgi:hypothetical protein
MKLTNILEKENNALIFEQHMNNSRTILSESVEGMNALQRAIVEGIYNDLKPLIEASLTADQVQQLFKGVEQNVSATGNNRTLVGAGKDAVGKANDTINKVGRWLKDTTPVQQFDQKFKDLKDQINKKFPDSKILDGVSALGEMAKNNPGKTAAIIGVLTVLAGLATGPVGGAVAGQVLRGASELIQGKDLSTAVGKGVKSAAIGAVAGGVGDAVAGGDVETATGQGATTDVTGSSQSGTLQGVTGEQIRSHPAYQAEIEKWGNDVEGRKAASLAARSAIMRGESLVRRTKTLSEGQIYLVFDRVCQTNNRMISEGIIWEEDSPTAPKMSTWDKIKTKASEFGKNLTTKVTASKLNSAWKAAKQPTDSEELAAFLIKQGINAEVVDKTFVDMQLPKPRAVQAAEEQPATDAGQDAATSTETPSTAPTATPTVEKPAVSTSATNSSTSADTTPQSDAAGTGTTKNTNTLYSQVRADIKRLDKRSKKQLMSYLEKGLSA